MSDDRQDFVPIEPMPAVARPVALPAPPVVAPTGVPSMPPPPPGYYNPPPPPPQYAPGQPMGAPVYGNYPGQYATYAAPAQPSGLAIASMVLGIVGVVFSFFYAFGLFPAIAAVITGHIARKKQPYARGFWLAGLITGYVGIGLCVLVIIGFVALLAFAGSQGAFTDGGN